MEYDTEKNKELSYIYYFVHVILGTFSVFNGSLK
jgi:hypothetical protein